MIRIMALALAVSGLCLGSAAWADEPEAKAVAFVEKQGGRVTRDEKASGKPVIGVSLAVTRVTDAGLKELAPLKSLTTLDLSFTRVKDAGVKELAALQNLTTLALAGTKVTDAGLKELQEALPKCKIAK